MWYRYIIMIFWACSSLLCLLQNRDTINEVKEENKPIVYVVYIIGGPIFMISNVLEEILDLLSGIEEVNDKNSPGGI